MLCSGEAELGVPAMTATGRRLTLDEFLALPEEKPALEYVDGEVVQKVSPQSWHSALQAEWTVDLRAVARPGRLAHVFPEHRSTYGGRSTVPDVAVYRWGRIPRDARGRLVNQVRIPPDLAIEIVSPDQSLRELDARCRWYVANGVVVALLTNPDDETVRERRPGTEPRVLSGSDVLDLGDALPGFTLVVGELFAVLTE